MKIIDFSKVVKAGILTASLVLLPVVPSALAQTETSTETGADSPTLDTTPFQETENDFNNLGWLGLIGLVGLANLFRKRKTAEVYPETDVASGTGYRE